MVLVIAAFYFWKGTMQLHEPPTGRRIRRFTAWQMAIHWTTAWTFVTLAITRPDHDVRQEHPAAADRLHAVLVAHDPREEPAQLHRAAVPVCIVLLFFTFVRDNFWRRYDWNWIRHFGGLVSKHDVPSGKFNAGEKAVVLGRRAGLPA